MKQIITLALVLILALSLLAACRSNREDETINTAETTQPLTPDNGGILPDADMLPDQYDTIDPSSGAESGMVDPTNGANHDTAPSGTDSTAPNSTGSTGPRSRTRPIR